MWVKQYIGVDEILIFDAEGNGEDDFFIDGDRNLDEYDLQICKLPLIITSTLKTDANQYVE